jgi:polysaccharide chain length determinant protein (PEP-CTERM system associated)
MDIEFEEEGRTLKDYLQIARRRKYLIAIPMLLFLAISVVVALVLPPVYQSEATILIEQQHIPVDLVKSTVVSFADERIQQIQQKIMTIENINNIINRFNLYPEARKKLTGSELAAAFRDSVSLEVVSADVISQGRKSKATLAFKLAFNHKNAKTAQTIASELVTLFLAENARSRTQRAKETTKFLDVEAKKFKLEIQTIENQIAEYKQTNKDSLPELLSVNLSSINRIEGELQQLSLQDKMLNERKINLRSQLAMTSPVVIDGSSTQPILESLPSLKAEYSKLLGKYSKSHPDVKTVKRKIDNYQNLSPEKTTDNINNPIYLQLKGELQIANLEITNIADLRTRLNQTLSKLEVNVAKTHQVERGYHELLRDLDNHKAKYQELRAKYLDAKLAQTLEEEQKAEKFSLLEPPRVPKIPEKPNRIKIIFMGFLASIGGGLGIGFLAEMMDGSIRGYKSLKSITGLEPLVVIPYIYNDEDLARSRKNKRNFIIIGIFILISMIVAIHFLYMPLDLILYKVLHRIETKLF